jgi:hypothetical protein
MNINRKFTEEDWLNYYRLLQSNPEFKYDITEIGKLREKWNEVDQITNFTEIITLLQPLVRKGNKVNKNEHAIMGIYLIKFTAMGGDMNYFITGAGAKGNCIIL